ENPANRGEWVASTRQEALNILADEGIDEAAARAIWTDVDEEFFLRERAGVIARWTRAIREAADSQEPVIVVDEAGLEQAVATRIFIHTTGLNNVFPITAATLDQLSLNIQDARLHTASTGHTFAVFYVLGADGSPPGVGPSALQITPTLSAGLTVPT